LNYHLQCHDGVGCQQSRAEGDPLLLLLLVLVLVLLLLLLLLLLLQAIIGQYYAAQLRFFRQLCTAAKASPVFWV
jgi:hypothetical protein